ncbi:MAG: hypothetical protein HKN40_09085, partial [Winogradskyella sp.]|uniref:hypothetical protein n=1 Tax=Winogradskyella sp. TaxID=1883156 RepID=UPI00180A5624|nr:hypothetical protein [Winogradskyella sp.]
MSKFYIILLALSISTILSSQCPNSSEILLRSQSAIEQYIDEFPNCEEFDGTLTIGHFGQPISTDIKDIS